MLNYFLLELLDSFATCAVDCFFLITGYFLYKIKTINFRKALHIIFVFCIYRFFSYILNVTLGYTDFTVKHCIGTFIPNCYFAIMYSTIIIIAPFCNIIMEKLSDKSRTDFIVILMCLFGLWPSISDFMCSITHISYTGLSNVSAFGNEWGYNIATFLMMYFIGSYIHFCRDNESRLFFHKKEIDILLYILISIFIFSFGFINKHASNYCSIFVIIQSILQFLFFIKLEFSSKIVNFFVKSVWGVYCTHMNIIWFWKLFNISDNIHRNIMFCLINVFFTVFSVLFVCILLDKFFALLLVPIEKLIDRVKFINRKLALIQDSL